MNTDIRAHSKVLHDQLTARLRALQSEVNDTERARREFNGSGNTIDVRDRKDEAAGAVLSSVGEAEEARDLAELKQVEMALQRIADGTYGDCGQCGEPISLERLHVQPAAERCIVCQTAFEHTAHQARSAR